MQDNVVMFPQPVPDDHTPSPRYTIPTPLTSLLGREYDIQTILKLLRQPDIRLFTLTGSGGIGKTRLAVQVATQMVQDFVDGVCFVSLATINETEFVLLTIAQALGLKETRDRSLQEQLHIHLQELQLLLVLDNYEQVIETASLLVEMLKNCPGLKILVTSRLTLKVHGEQEYPVAPLAIPNPGQPDSSESITQYASIALFLDRAKASKPDFEITPANIRIIAEICVRLDGLPLAIELAARWVKVLSVEQIAMRLNDVYQLLVNNSRAGVPRQQTLQATMDWSYHLLSEQERIFFCRLCVFTNGCTLEEIEAICAFPPIERSMILELLSHLIDQSLVYVQIHNNYARYRLLTVIQQYGQNKLEASGKLMDVRRRHRDWYLKLAEQAERELMGREQAVWFDRLEAEHDNLRAALSWSLEQNEGEAAARIAASIWPFWLIRGFLSEGRQWFHRILAHISGSTAARAKVLWASGIFTGRLGDATAMDVLKESLDLWRTLGDKKQIASVLGSLGVGSQTLGDYQQARAYYEESLLLAREIKDQHMTALVLSSLGLTHFYQGNAEQARTFCEESLALYKIEGDIRGSAAVLTNLGMIYLDRRDYEQANLFCEEGLVLRQTIGDKGGTAHTLTVLARISLAQKNYQQAATHYTKSLVLYQELDEQEGVAAALEGLAEIHAIKQPPSEPSSLPSLPQPHPNALTTREIEVLYLVAQGLTDAEVARRLVLSPRTIQGHMRSIYNKINVNSRSAATRFAIEHKLV